MGLHIYYKAFSVIGTIYVQDFLFGNLAYWMEILCNHFLIRHKIRSTWSFREPSPSWSIMVILWALPPPSLTTSYMDDPLPPSMIFKKLFCWIVSLNRYCSVVKRTPDWGIFFLKEWQTLETVLPRSPFSLVYILPKAEPALMISSLLFGGTWISSGVLKQFQQYPKFLALLISCPKTVTNHFKLAPNAFVR